MLLLFWKVAGGEPPPPPPPQEVQARAGGGTAFAIVMTEKKDLRRKRRVRLSTRGQLLFPSDLAEQQKIEDDWLVLGVDPFEQELASERKT